MLVELTDALRFLQKLSCATDLKLARIYTPIQAYPAPGAWSTWDGAGFKLTRAKISQGELSIGEIAIIDGDVVVGCGYKSALSLLSVVPAGKKEMKAEDWARGARLSPGAHFG